MATKKKSSKPGPAKSVRKHAKAETTKGAKRALASPVGDSKRLSALAAAAKVLGETGQPMTTRELIESMAAKAYWTSPGGKTPASTLYAALTREIVSKGTDARFQKTGRGKFALNDQA